MGEEPEPLNRAPALVPTLGLTLYGYYPEILSNFWTGGSTFSFCTDPRNYIAGPEQGYLPGGVPRGSGCPLQPPHPHSHPD